MKTKITKEQAEKCALMMGYERQHSVPLGNIYRWRKDTYNFCDEDVLIKYVSDKNKFLPIVECAEARGWDLQVETLFQLDEPGKPKYLNIYFAKHGEHYKKENSKLFKVKDHGHMTALILAFISIPNWERRVEHRRKGQAIGNGDTQKPCKRINGRDSERRNPLHKYKEEL